MNTKTNHLFVEAVASAPIVCTACKTTLSTITAQNPGQRPWPWERESTPLEIARPPDPALTTEAAMIRGVCPVCSAELASFRLLFRRKHGEGVADTPARLSRAIHGASLSAWAVLEYQDNGCDITEHRFGTVLAKHAEAAFGSVRAVLLDLPRPEAD